MRLWEISGGECRTAATSKMELFGTIVNGCKPLTIMTKCTVLDVAALLDPPLNNEIFRKKRANQLTGFYMIETLVVKRLTFVEKMSIIDVRQVVQCPSTYNISY